MTASHALLKNFTHDEIKETLRRYFAQHQDGGRQAGIVAMLNVWDLAEVLIYLEDNPAPPKTDPAYWRNPKFNIYEKRGW